MRLLALDLGTSTGFCLNVEPLIFGHWDLRPHRYESGGMRYIRFRRKLEEINEAYKIDLIAFEEVLFSRTTLAAHVYGGLVASLMVFCEESKIEYVGVPIGSWKRHLTGKGNCNKIQVLKTVREKYGLQLQTFDEADAVGILFFAVEQYQKREKKGR